jgi:hypothetical protein
MTVVRKYPRAARRRKLQEVEMSLALVTGDTIQYVRLPHVATHEARF